MAVGLEVLTKSERGVESGLECHAPRATIDWARSSGERDRESALLRERASTAPARAAASSIAPRACVPLASLQRSPSPEASHALREALLSWRLVAAAGARGDHVSEAESGIALTAAGSVEVDDSRLLEVHETVRAEEALFAPMGEDVEDDDATIPIDLMLVEPRPLDLGRLCQLAGREVSPEIQAAVGPNVPFLVYHGFTPFGRDGTRLRGAFEIGYELRSTGSSARTVAISPESEFAERASLEQDVDLGVTAGGEIGVPSEALAVANAIPGVSLREAQLRATTDSRFAFAMRVNFGVMTVIAGPAAAGGARWQLYKRGASLQRFQPLVQTLLVEQGAEGLTMTVKTWVRRPRRIRKARHWELPEQTFELPLKLRP